MSHKMKDGALEEEIKLISIILKESIFEVSVEAHRSRWEQVGPSPSLQIHIYLRPTAGAYIDACYRQINRG